jgi:hypothetical protein
MKVAIQRNPPPFAHINQDSMLIAAKLLLST